MPKAWEAVIDLLIISNSVREEPCLISQIWRTSLLNESVNLADSLIRKESPSAEQKQKIVSPLESFEDMQPLIRTVYLRT